MQENYFFFNSLHVACYPESLYLSNAVNTSNGPGLYALTGRPTICNAGKFVPICDTVSLSPLNIRRICAYSEGLLSIPMAVYHYF